MMDVKGSACWTSARIANRTSTKKSQSRENVGDKWGALTVG